jgi:hypothetical protein
MRPKGTVTSRARVAFRLTAMTETGEKRAAAGVTRAPTSVPEAEMAPSEAI